MPMPHLICSSFWDVQPHFPESGDSQDSNKIPNRFSSQRVKIAWKTLAGIFSLQSSLICSAIQNDVSETMNAGTMAHGFSTSGSNGSSNRTRL